MSRQSESPPRFVAMIGIWAIFFGIAIESIAADDETLWSLRPVRNVRPPTTLNEAVAQSPIDRFIHLKLAEKGLSPGRPVDRRTLIRRATFDLTGLPPSPDEIADFLADESQGSFANVVDRLLASPGYGERWGRHWLDVVRYADARDLIQLPAESDFREAWRYRDWVVAAFNRDLPYDRFIKMQVAGDLLQPLDPKTIDADALVATGMLAIADFVPGDVDKQQMIADYVNDQIDVVGRAILGLTLACARCHDHKFDPISTEDYYSLAGIFFSTRLIPGPVKGNTPLIRVPLLPPTEIAVIEAGQVRDKNRMIELVRTVSKLGEREYQLTLERRAENETQQYLLGAWDVLHPPSGQQRPDLAEFAKMRELDPKTLGHWITYCEQKPPHAILAALWSATDRTEAEHRTHQLAGEISAFAADYRSRLATDSVLKGLAESVVLHFRADDRRIVVNDARLVTIWPNRGHVVEAATSVTDIAAPAMTSVTVNGNARTMLRFSRNELLQVPLAVPATGSLFVVFRPDPAGTSGQRLVGWEDASVGQHGLGIMTDATGAMHVILRKNGANGDVIVPALPPDPATSGLQIVSLTWGPNGVAVHRNGQAVETHKRIDSVSSDPTINALRIGGPGSGSSPRFQGDLAELRVYDRPLDNETRVRIEAELTRRWCSAPESPMNIDLVQDFYEELVSAHSPFRLSREERDKTLPSDFLERVTGLREELAELQKKPPPEIPRAVVVQEGGPPGTPHEGFHDAHVSLRGNHANLGKIVSRGFPKSIAGTNPPAIREGSGRRELANWLTRPENPLTARVMVNRIWQHHFGVGLVATSANFGTMGDQPSHPDLLDFLATRFMASGWSVKSMHRLIMLSNVYQQNSSPSAAGFAVDPENRLLWRANRRRLEAEAIRDSLLAVAGQLDSRSIPGGPGFQDVATPRRSLYQMAVRTGAKSAEFGPLFDAPDCSGIVERRNESIVAPQALFLMNDPLVSDLATLLGTRIVLEVISGSDRQRIERLYEITLGRPPNEEEIEVGLTLVAEPKRPDVWAGYCRLLLSTNEFMFVD